MIRLHKHGSLFTALASVMLLGCVKGEQTSRSTDSTARNLTLAPTESTAAMKDVPAPPTAAAKPAPEKAPPVQKPAPPKPAAPAPLRLPAKTPVPLAATATDTTRTAKPGAAFKATPGQDVTDPRTRSVFPPGAPAGGVDTSGAGEGRAGGIPAARCRSVPRAGATRFANRHCHPAGGGSPDGVRLGLVVPEAHSVTHRFERVDRGLHEAAGLEVQRVRDRLVVQPGRRHGAGQRHVLVDGVAEHLIDGRGDARAAR